MFTEPQARSSGSDSNRRLRPKKGSFNVFGFSDQKLDFYLQKYIRTQIFSFKGKKASVVENEGDIFQHKHHFLQEEEIISTHMKIIFLKSISKSHPN